MSGAGNPNLRKMNKSFHPIRTDCDYTISVQLADDIECWIHSCNTYVESMRFLSWMVIPIETTHKLALGFVIVLAIAALGFAMISMDSDDRIDKSDDDPDKPLPSNPGTNPEPVTTPEPITRHTVIYDNDGKLRYKEEGFSYFYLEKGKKVPYIEPDSRECYVFKGWMYNNQLWNYENTVKADMILVPEWSEHFILDKDPSTMTATITIGDDWKDWDNIVNWNDGSSSTISAGSDSVSHVYVENTNNVTVISYKGSETHTSSYKWQFYPGHLSVTRELDVYFHEDDSDDYDKIQVKYGSRIPSPRMPCQEGKQFLGWYSNGKEWDFNEPIYSKKTLYAKWKDDSSYKAQSIEPVVKITEKTGGTILDASHTVGAAHYEWYVNDRLVDVSESFILSPEISNANSYGNRVVLKAFTESRWMATWEQYFS